MYSYADNQCYHSTRYIFSVSDATDHRCHFLVFIIFSIQDAKHQEFMNKTADRIKTEVSPAHILTILKKYKIENILVSIFIWKNYFIAWHFFHYLFLFPF